MALFLAVFLAAGSIPRSFGAFTSHAFVVLHQRWVVERTWSWLMNNRRLQVDYEPDPDVTKGVIWAVQTRLLVCQLTAHAQ